MALTEHATGTAAAANPRRVAALIIGDAIAFMAFAAIGRANHGEAAGLDAILQVAETAAPFAIGWFAVAPLAGAFRSGVVGRPRTMLGRTALAWLLAWPIGLVLRAVIRQTSIPLLFAVITLATVMLILLGWRGAFALLTQQETVEASPR